MVAARPGPAGAVGGVTPWETFEKQFSWRQGQHVTLLGPNGCGKTTLALNIIERRDFATVLGTKPADKTLQKLVSGGWRRIERWSDRRPVQYLADGRRGKEHYVLWPRIRRISDLKKLGPTFGPALDAMFVARNWCCFADETFHLSKMRWKVGRQVETMDDRLNAWWTQGRSIGLSLMAASQRPVWVPIQMLTEAQHLFLWATNDKRDLDRMRDISGPFRGKDVIDIVSNLDFNAHQVLYINTRSGQHAVTVPPA